MIWYQTNNYGTLIEKVDVIKETEKQVVIIKNGREDRRLKITDYSGCFKTIQEAKDFLIGKAKDKLTAAESSYKYYENQFNDIIKKLELINP